MSFAADPLTAPVEFRTPKGTAWFLLDDDGGREPFTINNLPTP